MSRTQTRNLIKFSAYSTCLVLPKKLLGELGWQVGNKVKIRLDSARHSLVLSKDEGLMETDGIKSADVDSPTVVVSAPHESIPTENDDDIQPIPEITT